MNNLRINPYAGYNRNSNNFKGNKLPISKPMQEVPVKMVTSVKEAVLALINGTEKVDIDTSKLNNFFATKASLELKKAGPMSENYSLEAASYWEGNEITNAVEFHGGRLFDTKDNILTFLKGYYPIDSRSTNDEAISAVFEAIKKASDDLLKDIY